jgi:hypothetical protein
MPLIVQGQPDRELERAVQTAVDERKIKLPVRSRPYYFDTIKFATINIRANVEILLTGQ